jgi:predicted nucleic acid-binding protein
MVPADDEVIQTFAQLTARCRQDGHPLQQKIHTGDRWVASCAVAKGLPLLAGDAVYRDTPDLVLLG